MISKQQTSLSSDRVRGPPSADVRLLACSICHDVLWKPIACQSCETPFCSACINRWITNNPNNCPNRCAKYTERKCPPFIAKLLAQLQISCFYQGKGCQQIISYEALERHEIECDYQSKKCPGCQSEILKKDFDNHATNCTSIELTCQDCKLVCKRGDAATKHTENVCLREQLRQLRDESKQNKHIVQELTYQLNEMRTWKNCMSQEVVIKFDDLPSVTERVLSILNTYKGLKWTKFEYMHKSFATKKLPASGYMTSFMPGGSPYIAYFPEDASITVVDSDNMFTLISFTACAAWNDGLYLTITGHRNSIQTNTHTTILLFGQPQLILLQWKDINRVNFQSSGGTANPGSGESEGLNVVIIQLTICPPLQKQF